MLRASFLGAASLIAAAVAAPAPLPAYAALAQSERPAVNNTNCQEQRTERRRRGRAIGGILGGAAGMFGGQLGGVAGAVTTMLPVGELLGEAIASMLDCQEQQKAATATEEAVRGGVGTTVNWTSESRPGVTGSSTVTAAATEADGSACMTVTDVVIVDGEETRAPKRMCRRSGSNRYVRV